MAADIERVHLNDIDVRVSHMRYSAHFLDTDGNRETTYLGKRSGRRSVVAYDKRKEQCRRGLPDPGFPLTRIETSLRKCRVDLGKLLDLPNPLSRIKVIDLAAISDPVPPLWPWFQDAVRLRGSRAALLQVPEAERKQFEARLPSSSAGWWDPECVWSTWPDVLERAGLAQGSSGR